jgi:hypothetical protein
VVRETEKGFAVRFAEMDARFRGVLRAAVAKALTEDEREEDDDEDRTLLTLPTLPKL